MGASSSSAWKIVTRSEPISAERGVPVVGEPEVLGIAHVPQPVVTELADDVGGLRLGTGVVYDHRPPVARRLREQRHERRAAGTEARSRTGWRRRAVASSPRTLALRRTRPTSTVSL